MPFSQTCPKVCCKLKYFVALMVLEYKNVQCTLQNLCFTPLFLFDHHECITRSQLSHPHASKGLTLFKELTRKSAKGGSHITNPLYKSLCIFLFPTSAHLSSGIGLLKFPAPSAIITVGQKNQASPHMHHQYRFTKRSHSRVCSSPWLPPPRQLQLQNAQHPIYFR